MTIFKGAMPRRPWAFQIHELWYSRIPNPLGILLLILATTFLGELKMNPFGSYFQFSLGTASFFFGLIWFQRMSSIGIGIATGVVIFVFRFAVTHFFLGIPSLKAWAINFPSIVFYVVFALIIEMFRVRRKLDHPLLLALAGIVAEVSANFTELAVRDLFHQDYIFDVKTITIITLFGILRSFFVVGIYHMITVGRDRVTQEHQQKRIDSLLLVNSSLYKEAVFLKKSMENIEKVTRQSYELYRHLRTIQVDNELSSFALHLAQEIHELKKDSQRILAGLSKIMSTDDLNLNMSIDSLVKLVARTNENYAEMRGKSIEFEVQCNIDLKTDQLYIMLSILNNIVANAVEAISLHGKIGIDVMHASGNVRFSIWNTGPAIPEHERDWIFQIGYTTKFDKAGNASTGIGLSHALDLVTSLSGSLQLKSGVEKTEFLIEIPMMSLLLGGQSI